jgi:signal transduction histidine kinase/ActR/RegA family two-component response regulator
MPDDAPSVFPVVGDGARARVSGERVPRILLAGAVANDQGDALRRRYEIETVPDGRTALARVHQQPPDLMLVVSDLPDVPAEGLLAEMRADARLRSVPVLVLGTSPVALLPADEMIDEGVAPGQLLERVAVHLALGRVREDALRREQAARAEAEAANRAKDEFIAMISHELRTPLGAILIWSQLLQTQELDQAAIVRAIGMIERSTKTLAQLIDDLLDVSRIIAGKLSLETRPVDLAAVVDAAIDAALPSAEAKGLLLERTPHPPTGAVSGDPGRLQQVVANLVSNAVKFTPADGRVEVRLEKTEQAARIRVSDTGNGISPEFLPFIFDRFRQADTSSTRRQKGLGLGLAIARHIVELHGGSIEAASAGEGQGSTFTVTLPFSPMGAPAAPPESRPADANLEGLRILLVDDEDDAREAMVVLLGQAGADVVSVSSAAEALVAMAQEVPDVLLSDIAMPAEDGYALIAKVRNLSASRGGAVPAAALTAYATIDDRSKALRAGFNEHVPKPVDPSRLIAVVAQLTRRRF